MFAGHVTLFRVLGIDIRVDFGWVLIAALIGWSLAQGVFPRLYQGLDPSAYWWMALAAVGGLGLSIILHELAHSFVSALFGAPVSSVTLFMFGGVAALDSEPTSPRGEALMALAGPAMSAALAVAFHAAATGLRDLGTDPAVAGVFGYLALLNMVIAIFNLVPAFPMDGGRALRAGLWAWTKDFKRATRYASQTGKAFGTLFMGLGVVAIVLGGIVSGIWWILIGGFIRAAAINAYSALQAKAVLQDVPVRRLMTSSPETAQADMTLDAFVERCLLERGHDVFPVRDRGAVVGCIGLRNVQTVAKADWPFTTVREVMTPLDSSVTTTPDENAFDVLARMRRTGVSRLLVVSEDTLLGVVTLKDLMDVLSLKLALDAAD